MNKEELEKLLERFKGELLDRIDQIEATNDPRKIRRPPPISPEIKKHNAAAGFPRTFRRKTEKGKPLGRASIRIEPDLFEAAKAAAEAEKISLSEWICNLIRKELNK